MKKTGHKLIALVVLPIASYLIAINFAFQLWSSLLLTAAIFVFFLALYNELSRSVLDRKVLFLIALSLVIVIVPPVVAKSSGYGDYPYPPFVIIPESKIETNMYFYPKYFETEHFTGFATYNNTQIIQVDLESNEAHTYNFGGHSLSEISSYAYFGNFLYVSGRYIDQAAGQDSRVSIMRVDLTTNEVESFLSSDQYCQVYNLFDRLLVSRYDLDLGKQVYELYDETMTVVGTLDNVPSLAYLYNVFNDGDYSVLIIGQYRYDLYYQGSFVKTLANYERTGSPQMVTFHDERIYINSGVVVDGRYVIDSFDLMGNKDETVRYTVPTEDDFVLFSEHQLIIGDGFYWDDIMLWDVSSVYDYDGNPIFIANNIIGLRIYEINGAFYGDYDGLYRLEERIYPVLFRFDKPQKNAVYYLSFLAVFLLIANTDEPLWKRKKPKTPEALTKDRF